MATASVDFGESIKRVVPVELLNPAWGGGVSVVRDAVWQLAGVYHHHPAVRALLMQLHSQLLATENLHNQIQTTERLHSQMLTSERKK